MAHDARDTLADPVKCMERAARLHDPHVRALTQYIDAQNKSERELPYIDPLGGGVSARALILLQSPARHEVRPRFVSQDNPGPAQRNLKQFLGEAKLQRRDIVLWNLIPWLPQAGVPVRKPRRADIREGIAALTAVLALLPNLQVVVFAGGIAQAAMATVAQCLPSVTLLRMPHPSPLSVCQSQAVPASIIDTLACARRCLHTAAAEPVGSACDPASERQVDVEQHRPAVPNMAVETFGRER